MSEGPQSNVELRHGLPNWPRLMSVNLAAAYLSISPTTLRQQGPKIIRIGRRVLYDRADLDAWADALNGQPPNESNFEAECREEERRFFERQSARTTAKGAP